MIFAGNSGAEDEFCAVESYLLAYPVCVSQDRQEERGRGGKGEEGEGKVRKQMGLASNSDVFTKQAVRFVENRCC